MENCTVILTRFYVVQKVFYGFWGFFFVEFDNDRTHIGVKFYYWWHVYHVIFLFGCSASNDAVKWWLKVGG
jgi:hypothetical protein